MSTDTVVTVTINGSPFAVSDTAPLSFRDVADLAGFKAPALPSMTLSYRIDEGQIEQVVHPGESVRPRPGMVFNVADTIAMMRTGEA